MHEQLQNTIPTPPPLNLGASLRAGTFGPESYRNHTHPNTPSKNQLTEFPTARAHSEKTGHTIFYKTRQFLVQI